MSRLPTPGRVVTDSSHKISYVNPEFTKFTGFKADEVLGKKCDFLQGEGTDPEDKAELRLAMQSKRETSVVILNYTKDHTPFWNLLTLKPIFDEDKTLTHYVGDILSLPIPPDEAKTLDSAHPRPKLCIDDALALMKVMYSSGPRQELSTSAFTTPAAPKASATKAQVALPPLYSNDDDGGSDDEVCDASSTSYASSSSYGLGKKKVPSSPYKHVHYPEKLSRASTPAPSVSTLPPSSSSDRSFRFIAETSLPTKHGRFRVRAYRDMVTGAEPLAMMVGDVEGRDEVVVRVHDQCVTSEVFGSLRCDCKEQLDYALKDIQERGLGIVFYLPQEGRGIGLANKVAAYAAQENGLDTVDANRILGLPDDAREYESVRDMLANLNVSSIRLITNNPMKIERLTTLGVRVMDRLPCVTPISSEYALGYVKAKTDRMGHLFEARDLQLSPAPTPPPTSEDE